MRGSLIALVIVIALCALLATWNRKAPEAAPVAETPIIRPEPDDTPTPRPVVDKLSIAPALEQLRTEAAAMGQQKARSGGCGQHLHPELENAFDVLSSHAAVNCSTPEQKEQACDMAVKLLDDHWALSDERPVDGTADEVRNHAVRVLENYSGGKHFGYLLQEGGEIPPSKAVVDGDAACVAAWRRWWADQQHVPD